MATGPVGKRKNKTARKGKIKMQALELKVERNNQVSG